MTTRRNPIATPDQAETELRALKVIGHPVMQRTIAEIRKSWPEQVKPSAEMMSLFDRAFEEVTFSAAVWSLNTDKERPKVVTITRLAHRLGEIAIPGSRWGLDNPDTVYRVIPISGDGRYVIRGRVGETRLTENYFSLWDAKMNSVAVLNGKDLVLEPDGRFAITVDGDPADGRINHIRSTPAAHEFYIRDVIQDWSREEINELSVERLGGAPATAPLTDDEQAELTASFLRRYATDTARWNNQTLLKPANAFDFTIDRDTDGAQRSQIYIMGHFKVADDEALVVNLRTGAAGYFIVPITNWWGTTNEIQHRTASLNKAQSVENADGTYTFVISAQDPGVHNWVDPCGLHEGILTLRWAEFAGGAPGPDLGADSTLVKLADLRSAVPPETRFLTAAERKRQQDDRAQAYAWRLQEN
jgi:limonene-1,2-epoxide hydrolase